MKKTDIYEMIIKVFGLYLLISTLNFYREFLTYLAIAINAKNAPNQSGFSDLRILLVICIFYIILLTVISYLFLIKTKHITKIISHPDDYQESIRLWIRKRTIYEVALTFTGLTVIAWSLPDFLAVLKSYAAAKLYGVPYAKADLIPVVPVAVRIVLGVLTISYSVRLASWLSKDKQKS